MEHGVFIYRPVISPTRQTRRLERLASGFSDVTVPRFNLRHLTIGRAVAAEPLSQEAMKKLALIRTSQPDTTGAKRIAEVESVQLFGRTREHIGSLALSLAHDEVLDVEFDFYRRATAMALPGLEQRLPGKYRPHVTVARLNDAPGRANSHDIKALLEQCNKDRNRPNTVTLGPVAFKIFSQPLEAMKTELLNQ